MKELPERIHDDTNGLDYVLVGDYYIPALRLTEESLAPVACLEADAPSCPRTCDCRTLSLWKGLDRVINDYLDNVTVADLIRRDDGPNV